MDYLNWNENYGVISSNGKIYLLSLISNISLKSKEFQSNALELLKSNLTKELNSIISHGKLDDNQLH